MAVLVRPVLRDHAKIGDTNNLDPTRARLALDLALWRWDGGAHEFELALSRLSDNQRWVVRGEGFVLGHGAHFDFGFLPSGVRSLMLWQDTAEYDRQGVPCAPPGLVDPRAGEAFERWLAGCRASIASPRMGVPMDPEDEWLATDPDPDPVDAPLVRLGPGTAPFTVVYSVARRNCALLQDWITTAVCAGHTRYCVLHAAHGGRVHDSGAHATLADAAGWLGRVPLLEGRWLTADQVQQAVSRLGQWGAFEDARLLTTVSQWNDEHAYVAVDHPSGGGRVLAGDCDGNDEHADSVSGIHGQEWLRLSVLVPATRTAMLRFSGLINREEGVPREQAAVRRYSGDRGAKRRRTDDDDASGIDEDLFPEEAAADWAKWHGTGTAGGWGPLSR